MVAVLDLFSAAAGGWSLGLHRAGFQTVAACEFVPWRRALYLQNNPSVRMYNDVKTLTGAQLLHDLGFLPSVVVGSPPCQDISSANTKGKGVEGERSGLYFEAIRIIREVRPRWFALENSSNLRTRGADAVIDALEAIGYTCWAFVVRAGDIGANHERPRSWLIGCDLQQVANPEEIGREPWPGNREGIKSAIDRCFFGDDAGNGQTADAADADGFGRDEGRQGRRRGIDVPISEDTGHASQDGRGSRVSRGRAGATAGPEQSPCGDAVNAERERHESGRPRRHGQDGNGAPSVAEGIGKPAHADQEGQEGQEGQEDGSLVASLRQAEITDDRCSSGRSDDGQSAGQMGLRPGDSGDAVGRRADWSLDDLANHLRVDAGLSAWVAQSRVAVGGKRGTSAASLIVEAFGDAVVPQIPEAIGRAILRTEAALSAVHGFQP